MASWRDDDPDLRAGRFEEILDVVVAELALRVRAGASGSDEEEEDLPFDEAILVRRLAPVVRKALVEEGREAGDTGAVAALDLLSELERLVASTLPPDARHFAARLSDPDGFQLVSELAHDLRSPLTSISFLSEAMRRGLSGSLTDAQRSQLGLIYNASTAMTATVADVVDMAEGGARVAADEPSVFSILNVFRSVSDILGPMAEEKGVELRLRVDARDAVEGHPVALERILMNLVVNGLKFTDQGFVEIGAEGQGAHTIRFSVRDTGRGLTEENRQRLYQIFRPASRREGAFFSSSGLGLTIVRRLLRALDSELHVESRPDWGTRFWFDLELRCP